MIPKFLRPEVFPFTSVEMVVARITDSAPPRPVACAWCPGFTAPVGVPASLADGVSHGLCDACAARLAREDRRAASRPSPVDDAPSDGSACGPACGYCGRCS